MSARDPDPFDTVDGDESDERDWLRQMEKRLDEADAASYPERPPMTDEEIQKNWIQESMSRYMVRGRPLGSTV